MCVRVFSHAFVLVCMRARLRSASCVLFVLYWLKCTCTIPPFFRFSALPSSPSLYPSLHLAVFVALCVCTIELACLRACEFVFSFSIFFNLTGTVCLLARTCNISVLLLFLSLVHTCLCHVTSACLRIYVCVRARARMCVCVIFLFDSLCLNLSLASAVSDLLCLCI